VFVIILVLLALLPGCTGANARDASTVVVALDVGPRNLDPRIGTDATSERIIQLIFSSLVKRSPEYSIEPDLALSWDIPDPLTYIFHLRKDATFHDGRPVTSRDVLYTFRSLLDGSIKTPKAGTFRLVESVEAPDEWTVIFKLKEPFAPFLFNLTRGGIGVVPDGAPLNFAQNPVGSGAFKFVRYVPDSEVVLERNDSYYGKKPTIPNVRFKIIPEAIVQALELRKGSVDVSINILPPDMVEALRGNSRLEVQRAAGTKYQYVAFNLKDPDFKDVRLRKAIAHAINRETIVQYLLRGEARIATGVIPPNNWSYTSEVTTYPYDPERSKQLLREAGKTDFSFTFRTSTDETTKLLAAVFQEQLRQVGIQMNIRSNETATFAADVEKGNFQAFSRQWVGGNNDPDIFNLIFHSAMTPPNGANRGFYANEEVDRLIEAGRREVDPEKRKAAYQQIQRIVADEVPYISLWYLDNVVVYNKRVSGMTLYPAGEYEFLADIQLTAE
jgi:peptide/nickel transport system substrate-binding protein